MRLPRYLLQHTVTIEPFEGDGAHGPTFGDPVTVRCYVEYGRRTVTGSDGAEHVSTAVVYADLDTHAPPGSRVTHNDYTARVITARCYDGNRLPVPSHLELNLE